jgi:hypothetical protein
MILPDEFKHLKSTYLGNQMEAVIVRTWIGWAFKAILGLAIIAACIKYVF